MARVGEIAGGHHETLDRRGYPRGLNAAQLSIPARILAIAANFEALSATDLPYKQGMPLSQSLAILADLRDRGRIDADLFDVFVRSGAYLTDAERFLAAEQSDAVDRDGLLRSPVSSPRVSRTQGCHFDGMVGREPRNDSHLLVSVAT